MDSTCVPITHKPKGNIGPQRGLYFTFGLPKLFNKAFQMLPVCCPGSLQDRDFMLVKCSEKDIVLYKTQEWQTPNHTIFWKPDSHSRHFTYIHNTSGNRNVARKCIVSPGAHDQVSGPKGLYLRYNPYLSPALLSLKKNHQLRMEGGALRKWRGKLNGHLQVIR